MGVPTVLFYTLEEGLSLADMQCLNSFQIFTVTLDLFREANHTQFIRHFTVTYSILLSKNFGLIVHTTTVSFVCVISVKFPDSYSVQQSSFSQKSDRSSTVMSEALHS